MGVLLFESGSGGSSEQQSVSFNYTPGGPDGPFFYHNPSQRTNFYCCRMWFRFQISAGSITSSGGSNVGTVTDRGTGKFRVTPLYGVGYGTFAMAVMHSGIKSASGISHAYRDLADNTYSFNTSNYDGLTDPGYCYGFIITHN